MSCTWLSYKLLSLLSNFCVNTQTSLSALDVHVNRLLLMTTRTGRGKKSNIAQTSRLLLHLNFEVQLLIAALTTDIKTCSKLNWHCLIPSDWFKPPQTVQALALVSSLRRCCHSGWLTSVCDTKAIVLAWKEQTFLQLGARKISNNFSFLHEERIPSCCLLSLCLHRTCAWGGQSSSINYFSTIELAIIGCQEQKHLMVCWMPLNVPAAICNSHQVVDLISSALLLRLGPRAFFTLHAVKWKSDKCYPCSTAKAVSAHQCRLTYQTRPADVKGVNSHPRIAYSFHGIW